MNQEGHCKGNYVECVNEKMSDNPVEMWLDALTLLTID